MATRSDFAQKLLNDLRMRKERMAASQSSSRSTRMAGDAYGNSPQNYKGSRQIKALESVGSRAASSQRRSNSGTRSLSIEESSKQLVLFGGGRNSEQMGDLSMALTFALENRGRFTKLESPGKNSMLSFLHRIGRRSLDPGKMDRRSSFDMNQPSSQFPTLSYVHINEISKGAQKLNQILRACSNGLNFDSYSIEIGRELLKGAMDLEESLRMLVNLQEASEYMITPQRKNRIRLLEEDEDDEDSTVKITEQKLVARPRFSFDKPTRNSHGIKEVTRANLKQNLMALAYPSEGPNVSSKKALNSSNPVPHKRSASCGPTLAAFSELKNHTSSSQSKPEKGRISNVIAKLMGLEEVPQNVDSKNTLKESSSKKKEGMVSKKITHASTKNAETKTRDNQNLVPLAIMKKPVQTNNIPLTQNIQVTQKTSSELMVPKLLGKDLEREDVMNLVSGSRKTSIAIEKQQSDVGQLNQITGSQNDFQEKARKQENTKHKEKITIERGENRQPVLKDEVQKNRSPEAANVPREKSGGKESTLQKGKRNANRLPPSNQQKPQSDHGMHQQQVLQKSEPQEEKHQAQRKEQQREQQKFQVRKQNGTEAEPRNPSKPIHAATSMQKKQQRSSRELDESPLRGLPNSKNQEDLVGDESFTDLNGNRKNSMNGNSDQNVSLRELGSATGNTKGSSLPVTEEKPAHIPAMRKKVDRMKVHTSETPRKIDEAITRRNGTRHNSARHQISILQELKQRRLEKTIGSKGAEQITGRRSKEAEVQNNMPKKSESSIKMLNGALPSNKEAKQSPILYNSGASGEYEHQSPRITHFPTPTETSQDMVLELSTVHIDSQEDQASIFSKDQELKPQKTVISPLNGADGESNEQKEKENPTAGIQESLTENEKHLKQILIKSQTFLNTAEVLFKLNMPFDILHVTDYDIQEEDGKLLLDCGYEITKRKGRRQELIHHPYLNISMSSIKVTSLDDLVKQLYKDIEKLKFYGGNGTDECIAADYLHKLLERDVQNRDPHTNSMWDLGWNETMFTILEKDDLVRDVERFLLNGLIDEITKDLLRSSVLV